MKDAPLGIKLIVAANILWLAFCLILGIQFFGHAVDWLKSPMLFMLIVPMISISGFLLKKTWARWATIIFYGVVFFGFTLMSWFMHEQIAGGQRDYYFSHGKEVFGEIIFAGYFLWAIAYLVYKENFKES